MPSSIPTVTIVGRPNVGKSTLFNRMSGRRKSIVIDEPNATRDWLETTCTGGGAAYRLVDTAGLFQSERSAISDELREKTRGLVALSELVLFMVDSREGIHPADEQIARMLRSARGDGKVMLLANKSEGQEEVGALADFYSLGFAEMLPVSAVRGDNLRALGDRIALQLDSRGPAQEGGPPGLRLAVVGKPNVGKSSLANALLGSRRVLVSEQAGTTRDCVEIPFEHGGKGYVLFDTAGLRRRAKVGEQIERHSNSRTVDGVKRSDVVIWMLDATEPVTSQDRAIMRLVLDVGKAMLIVLNKWDLISPADRRRAKRVFRRELEPHALAPIVACSSTCGKFPAGKILSSCAAAYGDATRSFSTRQLMSALKRVVTHKAPPMAGRIRPQLRHAHQGGKNPLLIVVHGNSLDRVGEDYRRYLVHALSRELGMDKASPRVLFRLSPNPYA